MREKKLVGILQDVSEAKNLIPGWGYPNPTVGLVMLDLYVAATLKRELLWL